MNVLIIAPVVPFSEAQREKLSEIAGGYVAYRRSLQDGEKLVSGKNVFDLIVVDLDVSTPELVDQFTQTAKQVVAHRNATPPVFAVTNDGKLLPPWADYTLGTSEFRSWFRSVRYPT